VKNITVTVDDEVYRRARIKAAQADTSVSALVRDFLVQLAGQEDTNNRLRRLQNRTLKTIKRFRASDRLSRDALHQR
jgi:plasmid stability protein